MITRQRKWIRSVFAAAAASLVAATPAMAQDGGNPRVQIQQVQDEGSETNPSPVVPCDACTIDSNTPFGRAAPDPPALSEMTNASEVRQNGDGNRAILRVRGSGNRTLQVQNAPSGGTDAGNTSLLHVRGDNNRVVTTQTGTNNRSEIRLLDVDDSNVEHIQEGFGLSFEMRHTGPPLTMQVVQTN